MSFDFTQSDADSIAAVLGGAAQVVEGSYMFRLSHEESKQSLNLTLHSDVDLGGDARGALVVAQTQHGYFELHNCSTYMLFEPDEVIFLGVRSGHVSCLVVGARCTCSMFVNIRREILTSDFGKLDPRVLMSAMQLSLTEAVIGAEGE